jgi:hypothetical protein
MITLPQYQPRSISWRNSHIFPSLVKIRKLLFQSINMHHDSLYQLSDSGGVLKLPISISARSEKR